MQPGTTNPGRLVRTSGYAARINEEMLDSGPDPRCVHISIQHALTDRRPRPSCAANERDLPRENHTNCAGFSAVAPAKSGLRRRARPSPSPEEFGDRAGYRLSNESMLA